MLWKSKVTIILRICLILALGFLLLPIKATPVHAAAITSAASGNWNTGSTWVGGVVPTASDTVTIASGHNVTLNASKSCAGITITGTLTNSSTSNYTLTVSGSVSGAGIIATGTTLGAAPRINFTGDWLFTGTFTGSRLNVSPDGTADQTMGGTANLSCRVFILNKSSGKFLPNGRTITISNSFTLTAGTLVVDAASWTSNYSRSPSAPSAGVTVEYTNANPTINGGFTYQNLTFSGSGTAGASSALTIQGNLANTGGGTLNFGSYGVLISGTVATPSIAGFTTTSGVSMTKTSGTATFTGAVNAGSLTINGTGGTLNLGTGLTHTFTGNWVRTAGTLNGGSSTLKIGGSISGSGGTFTAGTGTVEWNSSGAQSVAGVTYYNLSTSTGNTKALTGAVTVSNNLTIGSSTTLDVSGSNYAVSVGGNWSNNGAFTQRSGTVTFNGTTAQAIEGSTTTSFNNLTISNTAAAVTASTNFNIAGTMTVNSGGTLTPAAAVVINNAGAAGTITGSGTVKVTRTASTADYSSQYKFSNNTLTNLTVEYAGSSAQTLSALTYGNLKINNSSGVTAGGNATVNGVLTLTTGNLAMSTYTLDMGASATTLGATDVTGIVRRQSIAAETEYTFGSQYTSLTFAPAVTLPTSISVKLSVGSAPAWKSSAVQRIYELIRSDNSPSGNFTLRLHYLDTELNGNTEANLVIWDKHFDISAVHEHGRSNIDNTSNIVTFSNATASYLNTAWVPMEENAGKQWALAASSDTTNVNTWIGANANGWSDSLNWNKGSAPTSGQDAVIPDAATTSNDPTLPSSTSFRSLTIASGGILNGGSGTTLTLTSSTANEFVYWDNHGTFNAGTSTIVFDYANATISGETDFNNVTVATGKVLTLMGDSVTGIAGAITNDGTLYAGLRPNTTVDFNGTSQTIPVLSGTDNYCNLTLSGSGTKTLAGNLTINNNLTIESGTTLDTSNGNNYSLSIGGNWSNGGTFTPRSGTVTLNGTSAQSIGGSATTSFNSLTLSNTAAAITADTSFNIAGTMTVDSGAILTPAAVVVINSGGDAGTITGSGTVKVTRTASTADYNSQYKFTTDTLTNLTVEYTGSGAQVLSALTYGGLTINNSSGVTLGGNATVNGVLGLTTGNITTSGSYTMIISSGGSVSRTSGHIIGNLQKAIDADGSLSRTFEVGTGSDYTPVEVSLAGISGSGGGQTLTAVSSSGDHSNIGTSSIASSKSVNRYWTLTKGGDWTFSSYNATFTFVDGDKDSGANTANFTVRKYTSAVWSAPPGGVSASNNSTTGNSFTTFGDYILGELMTMESYLDIEHTTVWGTGEDLYSSSYSTVYMYGDGYIAGHSYAVGFYDGDGDKIATDAPAALESTTLSAMYELGTITSATDGTWHAVVFDTALGSPQNTYAACSGADGYVTEDSFNVGADAIPEIPSMLAGIGITALCAGIYVWMRRRSRILHGVRN